jgi:hypothetical protein
MSNDFILSQCSALLACVTLVFITFMIVNTLFSQYSLTVVCRSVESYIDMFNTAGSLTLMVHTMSSTMIPNLTVSLPMKFN